MTQEKKRLHVSEDIHQITKVEAAKRGISMEEMAEIMVREYVKKHEKVHTD